MYLLGSQQVADLVSRDPGRPVAAWLKVAQPRKNDLFVSAISLGMVAYMIEEMGQPERDQWRRALGLARRSWIDAGSVIDVDLAIVDIWSRELRALELEEENILTQERERLGEDERLVIATAIARGYSLVTSRSEMLDRICELTTLTIVEP